ncbi:hypothetical protein [uncultured Dokdonia sp.]|uniref:hypothetical protein n=1 Tax=uncultured Dokdonia sp. TaxID=575653 RepID=UPI00261B6494|nr:hypothetical protein [uncultured Dokdonia sp.]
MKKNILLLAFSLILTMGTIMAQSYTSGTITTSNSTQKGRVLIDYENQKLFLKKDLKVSTYSFDQVNSVTLGNTLLTKKEFNGTPYYVSNITSGKGNLYKINTSQYLVAIENGESVVINTATKSSKTPGVLAVLFKDCNSIRAILNNEDNFNEAALRNIVNAYNSCEYSTYTPTEKEIKNAATYNTDQASFYVGFGTGLNTVSFFDSNDTEALIAAQIQAGVIASPSFFGSIQGNLFISLEGSASFSGENNFNNAVSPTSFRVNSYRALLGLEYLINKTGKIKPFAGISIGVTSDSFKGEVDGFSFNITGGNTLLVPRIGARFQLPNQKHIGVTFSYLSEYENNLSFPTNDIVIPLIVNNENFTFSVSYYF